jgi:PST family polysaccharide transporter
MSLKADTRSEPMHVVPAIRWVTVAHAARQFGQLLTAVVLARLLAPSDFGLMTMALVVTGFLMVIRDLGVGAAVVQQDELTDAFASTQFWVALGFGVAATVLLLATAPLVAAFYGEPRVTDVVRALSVTFVISASAVVHQARLERAMKFRSVAVAELTALVVGAAVAIVAAAAGGGVWSLVGQSVMGAAVSAGVLWVASGWLPSPVVNRGDAAQAWRFGTPLTGYNAFNYVARNADYALIGRVLGSASLGFYTLAYRLMLVPLQLIVGVVNRVMFPALSAVRDRPDEIRRLYLRSLAGAAFLALPIATGIGASADRLIPTVLGPGWEPAIDVIRVLSIVAVLQTVGATVGPIYMATGRTGLLFAWGIVSGVVVVGAFVLGLSGGIVGVAISYAVASVALTYPGLAIPLRLIGLPVADATKVVLRSAALAAASGAVVFGVGAAAPDGPDALILVAQIVIGATTYALGSWMFNREDAQLALAIIGLQGRYES